MNNDTVTIVIPVYNSEKFLPNSVESALNQSFNNLEIIAVDDGSNDNSLEVLKKYENKISILHQENKGLAFAVNLAIKHMNGKWLKWLSPDDVLYPNAVEVLIKQAKKLPENTIIYSNWDIINEKGKKLRSFSESNYNKLDNFEFNVRLLDGQQINVNTTLIPSSLFKRGCLIQDLEDPVAVDYDFFLRAGILYDVRFYLIQKSLIKYRIHPEQLSHKKITRTLSYLPEVRNNILSKLEHSKKDQYLNALQEYNKKKPLPKKTMELGLKFVTSASPDWLTDRFLIFYLNKIRRGR